MLERAWFEAFCAALPQHPKVLDLGCGAGEPIARFLSDRGCLVTGVDSAPELIEIAKARVQGADWVVSDMRVLCLDQTFDGLIAWHSMFHLTPDDQRKMFPLFRKHAAKGAVLMFTSGTGEGCAMGEFEGEPLYHGSLEPEEYRALLERNDFVVLEHVIEDPDCGFATIWLAQFQG